jgi:AcrR family transcriptional regulator
VTTVVTRRERQREATYDEIVKVSRGLLRADAELSLRAVAKAMGVTAPALYRYVANYQELVDLVAFEIDKAATEEFRAAGDTQADDDFAGQLICASVAFRHWALTNPREFTLVFANPVADSNCIRREMLTADSSGHYFTDLLRLLWEQTDFRIPALDELPKSVLEVVTDPLIPAKVDGIAQHDRGLVWVFMEGWTTLYGVVALEVFGHMDPRMIASGEMFVHSVRLFGERIGLADDWPRLEKLLRARLAA